MKVSRGIVLACLHETNSYPGWHQLDQGGTVMQYLGVLLGVLAFNPSALALALNYNLFH